MRPSSPAFALAALLAYFGLAPEPPRLGPSQDARNRRRLERKRAGLPTLTEGYYDRSDRRARRKVA